MGRDQVRVMERERITMGESKADYEIKGRVVSF
jgi:hypothetical protein